MSKKTASMGVELMAELPAFANEANKHLDREVKDKEKLLLRLEGDVEENQERIQVMTDHLKNVQQELTHTEQLSAAKAKEIEAEQHMRQLAERETGRITAEMKKIDKQISDFQDSINVLQNSIFSGNDKLDQFKLQRNWNNEELEQWSQAAKQKDDDNLALERYTRADEQKIKDITLQVEKLTQDVLKKKAELDEEITETQASQIELDKTAEEFKRMHKQRQELIKQWEDTIQAMQRRDEAIRKAGEKFAEIKKAISEKQALITEQKKFLEGEVANNKEIETKITMYERQVGRQRTEFNASQQGLVEFQDEVEVLKNTLNKVAMDLGQQRSETSILQLELEEKRKRLENLRRSKVDTQRKLEQEFGVTENLEEGMKKVESYFKQEAQRLKEMDKEVTSLKDECFRQSQDLFKLRQEEANLIAEIVGTQAVIKNLQSQIHKLDAKALKQQELIYNQDFQIQQLERKVARAQGERTDEEKKILNARIQELQAKLDVQMNEHVMLTNQMKKLELDLRAAKRKAAELVKEKEDLEIKIVEINLDNESAERSLKGTIKSKEERMVQQNVMKLEVKRLRDLLNSRADEVFGLQNRKYQLKMSMEEREREIEVHKEMIKAQLKAADEDKHSVLVELKERLVKVDKLRNKYEVIAGKLKGDADEEYSPAYFVIKAAQEREELQRQGDELDSKIRQAEKEVRALQNTLSMLAGSNEEIRTLLSRVDTDSKEYGEKLQIEEQHRAAIDKLRFKKREIRDLQEELNELEKSMGSSRQEQEFLLRQLETLEVKKSSSDKELADQKAKLDRAFKQMSKLSKDHRRKRGLGDHEFSVEEKDFRVAELREFNKYLLQSLHQVVKMNPDISLAVDRALEQSGLKTISRAPSEQSSRPPSSQGSRPSTSHSMSSSRSSRSSGSGGGSMRMATVAL